MLMPENSHTTRLSPTMQQIANLVADSQENQNKLRQTINNVLSAFGQPVMITIIWYLKGKGVILDSGHNIDLAVFQKALQEITGDIAEMILIQIYAALDQACRNCSASYQSHTHPNLLNA
jgi:hypothetical protein